MWAEAVVCASGSEQQLSLKVLGFDDSCAQATEMDRISKAEASEWLCELP